MTDAKHEAPAEGAGELMDAAESIHAAALIYEDQALLDDAEIVLKHLRARSSAPEDREGNQPHCQLCGGTVEGWFCQTCEASFEEVDGLLVLKSEATHPAAPSADKLRIAVEALEVAKSQAERGADKAGCDGWRAQEMCRQIAPLIDQALADLKAEGA